MHEAITRERLRRYVNARERLSQLLVEKQRLERKFGLSGIDYSRVKVTRGNGQQLSEQERCAMKLERKNKEIAELEAEVKNEHEIIVTQISRLSLPKYRIIITLKYIEGYDTYSLVDYLFGEDPKWNVLNLPASEFKKTQEYENYRRSYQDLLSGAIDELEKISGVAFIPETNCIYKQLYLKGV